MSIKEIKTFEEFKTKIEGTGFIAMYFFSRQSEIFKGLKSYDFNNQFEICLVDSGTLWKARSLAKL